MNDKDYSPLSTACVRALQDKLYEKRKAAAVEIEKFVLLFIHTIHMYRDKDAFVISHYVFY